MSDGMWNMWEYAISCFTCNVDLFRRSKLWIYYIKRTLSLKKSGILNVELKKISDKKKQKVIQNKSVKNFILDENGSNITTLKLAKTINDFNNQGIELLNFFIGKPDGFSMNVDKFEKISLSKMTFPHSLVRVILCEQIYRCATILINHPYHKD